MASIQERGAGLSKILGPSRFVMDSGSRERFRDAGWYLIQRAVRLFLATGGYVLALNCVWI